MESIEASHNETNQLHYVEVLQTRVVPFLEDESSAFSPTVGDTASSFEAVGPQLLLLQIPCLWTYQRGIHTLVV